MLRKFIYPMRILIILAGLLQACSFNKKYNFEHEALSSSITFPSKPTISISTNSIVNAVLRQDNIIYCLELEPFDSIVSIRELWSTNMRLNNYDSETRTGCFNAPKTTYGIDTLTNEFIAGVVNFKNIETNSASTAIYVIKPSWRLSLEVGFNDLSTSLEERNKLKEAFFSTSDTEPVFTDLFTKMHSGLNSWNVEDKWK